MENRKYGRAIEDYETALSKGTALSAEIDPRLKCAQARLLMGDETGAETDFAVGMSIDP